MKISQLSKQSGESIPTLKFYIREGLLPPGEQTARNQSSYDATHIDRLQLIRALKEGLGMSLERIGEILHSADQGGHGLLEAGLRSRQSAAHGRAAPQSEPLSANDNRNVEAIKAVEAMCKQLGWPQRPEDPATRDAAQAVALVQRLLPTHNPAVFLPAYATAMKQIADAEIPDNFDPEKDPMGSMSLAVLGTYLFEPVLLALRRMAHSQRASEVGEALSRTNTKKS